MSRRRIVMISGAPGVGKTTIARPLARELGMPLFAKDGIKERMHDILGTPGPVSRAESQRFGAAAMELLWTLAADAPACVLEANFWRGHERTTAALRALSRDAVLVEVFLTCPLDEVLRRFRERALSGERHAVHPDQELDTEHWDRFAEPIGIGQVLRVDTSEPVNVPKTAELVRGLF